MCVHGWLLAGVCAVRCSLGRQASKHSVLTRAELAAAAVVDAAVNLRWYLDKADLKHIRLYTINGLLLLLVWGVARVVLFVPFYVHVLWNWVSNKT